MKPRYIIHAVSFAVMPWLMGGANAHWGQWQAWVFGGYWTSLAIVNAIIAMAAAEV